MGLAVAIRALLSRSSPRAAAVAVATGPLVLLLSTPAAAGPVPGVATAPEAATAAPRAAVAGPHCALGAGDGAKLHCFATFRAAVSFATGGRVTTAPATPAEAVKDPAFTAAVESVTAGSVLVGIEYADLNFGGASLSMYAGGRCDASSDADYRFPSMPAGWNDRVSSFRSYSNCAQQLFNSTNFGGALTGVITSLSYVGSGANDRASSMTFN